jgi:hypothetical protein
LPSSIDVELDFSSAGPRIIAGLYSPLPGRLDQRRFHASITCHSVTSKPHPIPKDYHVLLLYITYRYLKIGLYITPHFAAGYIRYNSLDQSCFQNHNKEEAADLAGRVRPRCINPNYTHFS